MNALLAALILAGPYFATVSDVIDGDTFRAEVEVWPGLYAKGLIRLRGIDAPEIRGKCESERVLALLAKSYLAGLLPPGSRVKLVAVGEDAYAGRYDAQAFLADGADISGLMVAAGYARPYDVSIGRLPWCP